MNSRYIRNKIFNKATLWNERVLYRRKALNDNKIEHSSEMKAVIKLCAISFSMVTLPVSFAFGQGKVS